MGRLHGLASKALMRRRRAQVVLARHGDQRFQALFEHAPLGVALCTLDGAFVDVNQAVRDLLVGTGVDPDDGGLRPLARGSAADDAWLAGVDAVRRGALDVARADLPLPTASGVRWLAVTAVRIALGTDPFLLVHLDDVTVRRAEEERLTHLALRDGLTGLANRRLLLSTLDDALVRAARTGLSVGVLYLDLDGFKSVNDTLGHDAGDAVLVAVAERLGSTLRVGDVAGRLGGDEFLVVAESVPTQDALAELVRRLDAAMHRPLVVRGCQVNLGVSVGAVLSRPSDTGAAVVRRADAAMFAAKRARHRAPRRVRHHEPDTVQLALIREQALVADG